MYYESIGEFEKAEDIYSTLLENNETDAIVRKRQISLLKEQNQIREAINELNSYLGTLSSKSKKNKIGKF